MMETLYYIRVSDFGKSFSAAKRAAAFLKGFLDCTEFTNYFPSDYDRENFPTIIFKTKYEVIEMREEFLKRYSDAEYKKLEYIEIQPVLKWENCNG